MRPAESPVLGAVTYAQAGDNTKSGEWGSFLTRIVCYPDKSWVCGDGWELIPRGDALVI